MEDELADAPPVSYSSSDSNMDEDHPPSGILYDSSDDEDIPFGPTQRFSPRNASRSRSTSCTLEDPPASVPVDFEPTVPSTSTFLLLWLLQRQFKLYKPGDPLIPKIFPHFVIYLMNDGTFASRAEIEAMLTGTGLERVKRVYAVEPAQYQTYHCDTLGPHPHCELNKLGVSNA